MISVNPDFFLSVLYFLFKIENGNGSIPSHFLLFLSSPFTEFRLKRLEEGSHGTLSNQSPKSGISTYKHLLERAPFQSTFSKFPTRDFRSNFPSIKSKVFPQRDFEQKRKGSETWLTFFQNLEERNFRKVFQTSPPTSDIMTLAKFVLFLFPAGVMDSTNF